MKKKLLVLTLLLIVVSGCTKQTKVDNGDTVVATIDGYTVTAQNLYEKLKTKDGINVLVDMIDESIVNKEIKDSKEYTEWGVKELDNVKKQYQAFGYDFYEGITSAGFKTETEFMNYLIFNHKKEEVAKNFIKDNINEKEINDYYEKNITGKLSSKHILITPDINNSMTDEEKKVKEKEAENTALDIIKKINKGEITFEQAVLDYSKDDASRNKEGQLATFNKLDSGDYTEEFFNTVSKLKDNEITNKPIKTKYGYHIVKKVSLSEKPKLEDVISSIKDTILESKIKDDDKLLTTSWVDIRKKYNIVINDTEMNESYKANTVTFK
jgi:parvulin-like peptidyl-prolyl isomerase